MILEILCLLSLIFMHFEVCHMLTFFLLSMGQIFLVLCILSNFLLYSVYLKYYVVKIIVTETRLLIARGGRWRLGG